MDHLLPPLGVSSGRERETLQTQGTGCSATAFQWLHGSKFDFLLSFNYKEFSLQFQFLSCVQIKALNL